MRNSTIIVEEFPLPDNAPKAVIEAHRRFTRGVDKLNETRQAHRAAAIEVEAAKASAQADTVAAILDGKDAPDHTGTPTLADIERLEDQVSDLLEAVDAAGTALAKTIKEHGLEWAKTFDSEQANLAEKLEGHLQEAAAVLVKYEAAAAAGEWLAHFWDQKRNEYNYRPWQGGTSEPIVAQVEGPIAPPTPVTQVIAGLASAPAAMRRRPAPSRMVAAARHVLGRECEVCNNDPATHVVPDQSDLIARCNNCQKAARGNPKLREAARTRNGLAGPTRPQFSPGPPPFQEPATR